MLRQFLIFICLFFPTFLFAKKNKEVHAMEDRIKAHMERFNAIGISIAVVKDGEIFYNQVFGYNPDYSDSTLRRPIPHDGIYWIASISKTFVATAIMQLVEQGKLTLEDDINHYLKFEVKNPAYPFTPITIRHLLCHRSSLNDSQYRYSFDMLLPEKNPTYRKCYNDYAPGTDYNYCNLGYNLLGAIIENVSGERFDDYIDYHIIRPLKLYGGFNVSKLDSARFVWTYKFDQKTQKYSKDKYLYTDFVRKQDNYVMGYTTPNFSPAGGMKISATGLARYMMMHMNGGILDGTRILSEVSEQTMREIQTQKAHYALSFRHYNNSGYKVIQDKEFIGQTGGSHGIHSSMIFHPTENYGFVVICNGCNSKYPDGADLANNIIRECFNNFIKPTIEK